MVASDNPVEPGVHIALYRCDGTDQVLSPGRLDVPRDVDKDLLWVDIGSDTPAQLASIAESLQLPAALVRRLQEPGSSPTLKNFGEYFFVRVVAVEHVGDLRFEGAALCLAGGPGLVISVHHRPIGFIPKLRSREDGESHLGMLTADSFVASLLDWHLGSYFEAASDFGRAVEKLEEDVLKGRHENAIADLRKLRKGASRLRRMLAPHREVFASLARPDFRPDDNEVSSRHFEAVYGHFERAMDVVENARDLMIGSFELFSNQLALRTNQTMRALTFATVMIGCQTVIAGMLGMNFNAPFFDTASLGFWLAV